jgi:transcriptional regulator with PAS, ATPase and Fis domain
MKKNISNIAYMQAFVQEYAETITDVLELYVTIIDEDCIRIGGTGPHAGSIGSPIPCGSFFRQVLASGEPGFIRDRSEPSFCQACDTSACCQELATMGFPICKAGRPVGVIGVTAFTAEQKERLASQAAKFLTFLRHMSSLLESKLLMLDEQWRLQNQMQEVLETANQSYSFGRLLGRDKGFIELLQRAERVARSTSTVLIQGESGTGKELLARAVHDQSGRAKQPFIIVNCPSIPENLLESELFGYEAGAFTGASRLGKKGKFEQADQGTLFLDEIGDLPLALQPKLLRAIQERTIERIAGMQPIAVDVRIIAATNRDLEKMVRDGQFREDLYYRLNVIPLSIPPLRSRPLDIPLYLEYFMTRLTQMLHKPPLNMDEALRGWLMNYAWPGNVRQLEHVIEYLVNVARGDRLSLQDLPPQLLSHAGPEGEMASLEQQLADFEKQLLMAYIPPGATVAEKRQAAQTLQISLATLYRKLEKYQLG